MEKMDKRIQRNLPADFKDKVTLEDIADIRHPAPLTPAKPDSLWYEIAYYGYYFFSSRPKAGMGPHQALAVITLYTTDGYVGAVSFYADDEPLEDAELLYRSLTGIWVVGFEYHISQFHDIMEMLRTEPHVFAYYEGPHNSKLSTVFPADYYD